MAVTTIPWGDGSGDNIYLIYPSASGDQTVQVSSDANTGSADRTKVVTFSASANGQTVTKTITVNQEGVPEQYIVFADPVVGQICATTWGDGTGIKPSQAAQVTNSQLGTTFKSNAQITSFDEFRYFTGITSLNNAFYDCSALQSIILPPTLQTIGTSSFVRCNSLTSIEIPSTVTSIGTTAFYNCGNLATIVLRPTTPPSNRYTNAFQGGPSSRKYYVPYSADHSIIALYKATSRWSESANSIYELNPDGTIPT